MKSRASIAAPRIALSILALLVTASAPAGAQSSRSQSSGSVEWAVEPVAGLYVSDLEIDEEEPAFGFRVVVDPDDRWGLEAQAIRLTGDREREFAVIAIAPPPPGAITNRRFEYEAIALDLSARLRLTPEDSPARLHLLFGPGWGFVDAEIRVRRSNGVEERFRSGGILDDSFTVHGGLALSFDLAESWYLRFDGRVRYWEERPDNDTDQEYTVGLGFRL